ncbi:preprotein translocase subunit SecA [Pseudoalteromonas rubra]|uniref:Preprotein translocase subunit SecA n=2 Tax=Pseudoalteromonas rubra TaxID=43658 RepID=A0A0U3I390_9GAMM|nr:preprotein translocase subunit SecA [Pseudoalteromonas rubra]
MCYCGSEREAQACCLPFIAGQKLPDSAEQLMRSRYSAYCLKDTGYIHRTYAQSKRAENCEASISAFAEHATFVGLEVIQCSESPEHQFVEFKATYLDGSTCITMHERSRFLREDGQWRYLDGELFACPEKKISRNDPCPCQSGKKFKKCHG